MSPADQAVAFLTPLFPAGGFIELRALPAKAQCFIKIPDGEALRGFLASHGDQDLYFGVAARREATNGKLDNCDYLSALFTDLDFKTRPEGEAREAVAAFPLPPSAWVDSGGGLHVYWLLREPIGLAAEAGRAKALLRRLAYALGGDLSAAEPARVLRVPGTRNHKYTPPRPVTVELLDPTRRYNPSEFEWLLPEEPGSDSRGAPFTVPEKIREGERNDTLFRFARSLHARGLAEPEILAALRAVKRRALRPAASG